MSVLETSFVKAAQPGVDAPAQDPSAFIEKVAGHYQHVVIGENHADFRASGKLLYTNPHFYEALQKSGVKNFLIELPRDEHELIQAYYNRDKNYFGVASAKDITAEMFAGKLRGHMTVADDDLTGDHDRKIDIAKMIDLSRDHGIKIWPMDEPYSKISDAADEKNKIYNQELARRGKALVSYLEKEKGVTLGQFADDLLKSRSLIGLLDRDQILGLIKKGTILPVIEAKDVEKYGISGSVLAVGIADANAIAGHEWSEDRFKVDRKWWAGYIKDNVPAGEKTVSMVGFEHTDNEFNRNGIDEILGGDKKVATILLARDQVIGIVGMNVPDPPHAVIDLETGTVTPGPKLDLRADMPKKPAPAAPAPIAKL